MKKETLALVLFIIVLLLLFFGCKSSHIICKKTPRVVYVKDFDYDFDPLHEQIKCLEKYKCFD